MFDRWPEYTQTVRGQFSPDKMHETFLIYSLKYLLLWLNYQNVQILADSREPLPGSKEFRMFKPTSNPACLTSGDKTLHSSVRPTQYKIKDNSMQFSSVNQTPSRKLGTCAALEDATTFIKKNALRKAITLLDKHFLLCQQQNSSPEINFQLCRRLLQASRLLVLEYIKLENLKRVDTLLDRCNLYIAVEYINLQRMLHQDKSQENTPNEQLSLVQMEQKLGLQRLRYRIRQSIVVPGSLIRVDSMKTIKNCKKIKFYLYEFWASILNHLTVYTYLFKATNEVQGALKMMKKLSQIVKLKEFKEQENTQILKMIIQYHQMAGQLYFQLCEFKLAIENHEIALNYVQQLINISLSKTNCPKVFEYEDIKHVIPHFMSLVILLNLLSYSYEYLSRYSKMYESLHLAYWIVDELLRLEEEHQLRILMTSRIQDAHSKYMDHIKTEAEIVHCVVQTVGTKEEIQLNNQDTARNDLDLMSKYYSKFYMKYKIETLNKQQYLLLKGLPSEKVETAPVRELRRSPTQLYSIPKGGSKTEREKDMCVSKHIHSFTTQDIDVDQASKRFYTYESDHLTSKSIKSPIQEMAMAPKFKPASNVQPNNFLSFLKQKKSDCPHLDNELSLHITKRLQSQPSFFDLTSVENAVSQVQAADYHQRQDVNMGKTVLQFKKQITRTGLNDPELVDITRKQLENTIKTECTITQGCLEAEEFLKRRRQQKQVPASPRINQLFKQTSKFRRILIKHSNTLKLKRLKKMMIHKEEESALRHLQSTVMPQKTGAQDKAPVDEKQIIKKTVQTNLNVIKLVMDENQKQQDNAMMQLRQRHLSQSRLKTSAESPKQQRQQKFAERFKTLAQTTNLISTRSESSKKISSIVDLANIKRKLVQLEKKETGYSDLFRSELE